MLAGDVETNPGPACDSCGNAIRRNQLSTKVACRIRGCNAVTHRCRESGISRYDPAPNWHCRFPRGLPPFSQTPLTAPTTPCDTCGGKFRSNQLKSKVDCNQPGCTAATHRCPASGISRYAQNPVWTCRQHRGEPALGSNDKPSIPAKDARVTCLNPKCKTKTIKRPPTTTTETHLPFTSSGRFCHKKTEFPG